MICIKKKKKKYLSYTGFKTFKCPPSPRVSGNASHFKVKTNDHQLNPYFITGFSDAAAGRLFLYDSKISQSKNYSAGWIIHPVFTITLHKKDWALLNQIKSFFGVGEVRNCGKDSIQYRLSSIKHIEVIRNHFDKFPLITQNKMSWLSTFQTTPQGGGAGARGWIN